jgi:hypothetical protein
MAIGTNRSFGYLATCRKKSSNAVRCAVHFLKTDASFVDGDFRKDHIKSMELGRDSIRGTL